MRRLATIGIVLTLIAAACGGTSDDSAGDTTTTTSDDANAPLDSAEEQDDAAPEADAEVEAPTAEPEPDPTATAVPEPTATTVPEPVVINAIGIGLDQQDQLDFAGEYAPDADLNATLIVGSPLKIVVTSQHGFQPGCLGMTVWDPDFVVLVEGYRPLSPGGCDAMSPPVVFPDSAMLVDTPYLMVIQVGEMPPGPYVFTYQRVDPGGSSGTYRRDPDAPADPGNIPSIVGADVVIVPTGPPFIFEDGFESGDLTAWSSVPDAREFPVPGSCVPDDQTLCLANNRFAVEGEWTDGAESGPGTVFRRPGEAMETDASGLFAFVNPDNWALLVRVMNGCDMNANFWVFAAGLTSVEYNLTVTDTLSGEVRTYDYASGMGFTPIVDTEAFATCP